MQFPCQCHKIQGFGNHSVTAGCWLRKISGCVLPNIKVSFMQRTVQVMEKESASTGLTVTIRGEKKLIWQFVVVLNNTHTHLNHTQMSEEWPATVTWFTASLYSKHWPSVEGTVIPVEDTPIGILMFHHRKAKIIEQQQQQHTLLLNTLISLPSITLSMMCYLLNRAHTHTHMHNISHHVLGQSIFWFPLRHTNTCQSSSVCVCVHMCQVTQKLGSRVFVLVYMLTQFFFALIRDQ